MGLPAGDGTLVIQRVRNLAEIGHVPIVVVTAADAVTMKSKLGSHAVDAIFQKPVDDGELLTAIRGALGDT
jgi:DNA-binding response OmpR family regulator